MDAIISVENGRIQGGEYFVINLLNVDVCDEMKKYYPNGKNVCLRFSCSDYDYLADPEKVISDIVKSINQG